MQMMETRSPARFAIVCRAELEIPFVARHLEAMTFSYSNIIGHLKPLFSLTTSNHKLHHINRIAVIAGTAAVIVRLPFAPNGRSPLAEGAVRNGVVANQFRVRRRVVDSRIDRLPALHAVLVPVLEPERFRLDLEVDDIAAG